MADLVPGESFSDLSVEVWTTSRLDVGKRFAALGSAVIIGMVVSDQSSRPQLSSTLVSDMYMQDTVPAMHYWRTTIYVR